MRTIKKNVESVLKTHSETRNSDRLLWILYLVMYHELRFVLGDKYQEFRKLILSPEVPMPDRIRLLRQEINEEGLFIPADSIKVTSKEIKSMKKYLKGREEKTNVNIS